MMRLPRVRVSVRWMMISVAVIGIGLRPARWVWRAQGGSLPALKSLRLGMTQEHVEAVVGPPSSEGIRPDGSVWKIITRPGSFYWVELDYDANGRLRSFRKDCF